MVVTKETNGIDCPLVTKTQPQDSENSNVSFSPEGSHMHLPRGILGFPDFKSVELVYSHDELPFMRLRDVSPQGLEFIVLEPYGFFPDYQIEITDEDVKSLDITGEEDVYLLNIVTVHRNQNGKVTVNLAAPLVFNKRTLIGKQSIIANFSQFSSKHVLGPFDLDDE